jgi:hypothetical protein
MPDANYTSIYASYLLASPSDYQATRNSNLPKNESIVPLLALWAFGSAFFFLSLKGVKDSPVSLLKVILCLGLLLSMG